MPAMMNPVTSKPVVLADPAAAHAAKQTERVVPANVEVQKPGQTLVKRGDTAHQIGPAVEMLNRALQDAHRELRFSVDESSGRMLVQVLHPSTGTVIRQMPSEAVLAMAAMLESNEPLTGLGVDASA